MSYWYVWFLLNTCPVDNNKIDLHIKNKNELSKIRTSLDLRIPMDKNSVVEGQMYDWLAIRSGVKFVFHVKSGMTISLQLKFPGIIQ